MMKRMFVIYGKRDSGKTHTARLVLAHLLENGAEFDHLDNQSSSHQTTVAELLSHPEPIGDVCAFVRYNGKLIMVLSAGDELPSFCERMEFAQENGVDIVVCCARSRNNPNSVYREILDVYQNQQHLLTDDDWFWIEKVDEKLQWLIDRNNIAIWIVNDIDKEFKQSEEVNLIDCDRNDSADEAHLTPFVVQEWEWSVPEEGIGLITKIRVNKIYFYRKDNAGNRMKGNQEHYHIFKDEKHKQELFAINKDGSFHDGTSYKFTKEWLKVLKEEFQIATENIEPQYLIA